MVAFLRNPLYLVVLLELLELCGYFGGVTGHNDSSLVLLSTSILENATIGTTIFQVEDSNLSSNAISIISGNMNKRFVVDQTKPVIYLAGYLDHDIETDYWLSIAWNNRSDNRVALFGQLHVTVVDVIDWPPVYNESCVFDKRKMDLEWYYPFPFAVEYFYPGSTMHHSTKDNRWRYTQSNLGLSNSLCHVDITAAVRDTVLEILPYFNFSCYHGKAMLLTKSDIESYRIIEDIPMPDTYNGSTLQRSASSFHFHLISNKEKVNKELTCRVHLLPGYENIQHVDTETLQRIFSDHMSIEISAVINYIGCPDGKYGGRCQYDCICQNGATCHVFNGACKCPPGWRGVACDIASPNIEISPHGFIEADFGEYVSIYCAFHHFDQSHIFNSSWMRDNESMAFGRYGGTDVFRSIKPWEEGNAAIGIEIFFLRDHHAGRYQCLVTDINGEQYRDDITIKVTGCAVNHWGIECDQICDCQNGGNCTRSSGCVCQHGWNGRNCSLDIEPPRFTFCPRNLSQTVETDITSIEVTWPLPEVIDNSDVNLTSNFDPGDEFTIGAHQVVYTAKDVNNNNAECRFSVFLDRKSTIGRTVIISLSIATVVVMLLFIVLGFLCFRHRRTILLKYTILTGKVDDELNLEKKWDAFVACKGNTEEETFVYKTLIPELEEHGYRLNVHHKDFLPGEAICTNIVDAITKSRRTILVMSPSFVRSGWCIYELEQAYHEMIDYQHKLIPIMFEDITDMPDLPPILQTILKTISYIDWSKNGTQKDKTKFWKRLIKVMPKKRKRAPNPCVKYLPLVANEEAQILIDTACV
ncbi:uncharacterized protein LOC144451688 [Glandiceps talaboti]